VCVFEGGRKVKPGNKTAVVTALPPPCDLIVQLEVVPLPTVTVLLMRGGRKKGYRGEKGVKEWT